MDHKDQAENSPLIEDEDSTQSPSDIGDTYQKPSRGYLKICLLLLVLQLANILLFVGGPAIAASIGEPKYHQQDDCESWQPFNHCWMNVCDLIHFW